MNCISTDGDYKFEIDTRVIYAPGRQPTTRRVAGDWHVKFRYTARFERNAKAAIPMYVIWDAKTNALATVSEIVLHAK